MRVCLLSNFGIYHRCLVICFESPDRIFPTVPPIQSCRSAPSRKLAGCRSSRHVNRTMHPNRLPRVQRASRSLDALVSLSLWRSSTHPPASMRRESGSNCFLAHPFAFFVSFCLSLSLFLFDTVGSPRFPYEFGSFPLSSFNGRAEFRTDPCSLQRNNRNGGPRGWFG